MNQKLAFTSRLDQTGTTVYNLSKPRGGGLTVAEIRNFLVNAYGGGVYVVVINARNGTGKTNTCLTP